MLRKILAPIENFVSSKKKEPMVRFVELQPLIEITTQQEENRIEPAEELQNPFEGFNTLSGLPPEILCHIISYMPLKGRMNFSSTSRLMHDLVKDTPILLSVEYKKAQEIFKDEGSLEALLTPTELNTVKAVFKSIKEEETAQLLWSYDSANNFFKNSFQKFTEGRVARIVSKCFISCCFSALATLPIFIPLKLLIIDESSEAHQNDTNILGNDTYSDNDTHPSTTGDNVAILAYLALMLVFTGILYKFCSPKLDREKTDFTNNLETLNERSMRLA